MAPLQDGPSGVPPFAKNPAEESLPSPLGAGRSMILRYVIRGTGFNCEISDDIKITYDR